MWNFSSHHHHSIKTKMLQFSFIIYISSLFSSLQKQRKKKKNSLKPSHKFVVNSTQVAIDSYTGWRFLWNTSPSFWAWASLLDKKKTQKTKIQNKKIYQQKKIPKKNHYRSSYSVLLNVSTVHFLFFKTINISLFFFFSSFFVCRAIFFSSSFSF